MKSLITLTIILFTSSLFSQQMITKDVGDFSELKVFDLVFVRLIPSEENKVVIKGEYSNDIKVINDNGTLKVRMHTEKRFHGEDTYIEVYAKNIDVIDANEGTEITVNEVLKQNNIELRAQEGGTINIALNVKYAKIKSVTGGIIEATGTANMQEITLNTGGIFNGRTLQTENTKVKITAAGEAEVRASNKVDAKVTAGGDIVIFGNPTTVNKKQFAGGRIKVM